VELGLGPGARFGRSPPRRREAVSRSSGWARVRAVASLPQGLDEVDAGAEGSVPDTGAEGSVPGMIHEVGEGSPEPQDVAALNHKIRRAMPVGRLSIAHVDQPESPADQVLDGQE